MEFKRTDWLSSSFLKKPDPGWSSQPGAAPQLHTDHLSVELLISKRAVYTAGQSSPRAAMLMWDHRGTFVGRPASRLFRTLYP